MKESFKELVYYLALSNLVLDIKDALENGEIDEKDTEFMTKVMEDAAELSEELYQKLDLGDEQPTPRPKWDV